MPYLIDSNVKMTETRSIINYVIERSNKKELLGKDLKDNATILNIEGLLNDVLDNLLKIIYTPKGLELKDSLFEKIRPKITQLCKFNGNKEWLLGYLTLVDFLLVEIAYYIEQVYPALYAKEPFLKELRNRFNALPEIKKYYEKPDAVKAPFVSPAMANIKF